MQYIVAVRGADLGIGHAWWHEHPEAVGGMSTPKRQATGERPAAAVPPPRSPGQPYRVCMVCLGNICRSPTAEVVLRDELRKAGLDGKVTVDSAGTGDWHLGEAMHPGARAELARRGLDGSGHRARQLEGSWLGRYDLLLAMDRRNLAGMLRLAGGRPELDGRILMFRSFDLEAAGDTDVPDPYDGGPEEFAEVFDLVSAAARGLVRQLAEIL
jgi:protein-tyrosine phosphatase